jgi:CRISPR-associated protein Cas2
LTHIRLLFGNRIKKHYAGLVSYDINTVNSEGARCLRNVSKICLDYGQRVQFSVFECEVDPTQWVFLKDKLLSNIDFKEDKTTLCWF